MIDKDTTGSAMRCGEAGKCDAVCMASAAAAAADAETPQVICSVAVLYFMNHLMLPASYIYAFNIEAVVHVICIVWTVNRQSTRVAWRASK